MKEELHWSLSQAPLSRHQILCQILPKTQRHKKLERAQSESKATGKQLQRRSGKMGYGEEARPLLSPSLLSCCYTEMIALLTAKRMAEATEGDFRLRSHLQGYHHQTQRQLLFSGNEDKVRHCPNLAGTATEAQGKTWASWCSMTTLVKR